MPMYIKMPFISHYANDTLKSELRKLFLKHLPQIDTRLAVFNNYKIKTFFKCKESLPKLMRSSVVYCFKCSGCSSEYIGSTKGSLSFRVDSHLGISSRTRRPLVRPSQSSIRNHLEDCNTNVNADHFDILCTSNSEQELRILESILIKFKKPSLNIDNSAFPLYIL